MTDLLSIFIAQLNPTVGDIAGNLAELRDARARGERLGADLVVTPSSSSPAIRPRIWC